MATKQGLQGQLSQASEDAKRAVLLRTPQNFSSAWLSNLNTTCTIKSAPPRSPEVLALLSTKCGWLWKRNEQHYWQPRWCCVVPHTFLYYFDSPAGGVHHLPNNGNNNNSNTQNMPLPTLSLEQQEAFNQAVKHGYSRPQSGPRKNSLYHHVFESAATASSDPSTATMTHNNSTHGNNNTTNMMPQPSASAAAIPSSSSTPAGIIDLECYTSVARSSENELILELGGDDPELRSFYFGAGDAGEGEAWTQAFLSQRHSQLTDERDAYRQVCDGFAQQLQELHQQLDDCRKHQQDSLEECYFLRSAQEETRRQGFRVIQEALERQEELGRAYRTDLETIRQHDLGLLPAVQLLSDYSHVLEVRCQDLREEQEQFVTHLEQSKATDKTELMELQHRFTEHERAWKDSRDRSDEQVKTMQQTLAQSQKALVDAQQELASTKMDMTMYQNSTKAKLAELMTHKKILKKEVIDLRKQLDEVGSELSLLKHTTQSSQIEVSQERRKSELLERYVEKMESQVKVQQNMMEMMSQSGMGSVHGGGGASGIIGAGSSRASFPHHDYIEYNYESVQTSPRTNVYVVNTPSSVEADEEDVTPENVIRDEHDQLLRRAREMVLEDEKSHMSELTEDRTQRHIEGAYEQSPLRKSSTTNSASGALRVARPPSYIGMDGGGAENNRLDTIMSSASASLPPTRVRRSVSASDTSSVGSGLNKLSVAQRARLEANQHSNSVRVRPSPVQRAVSSPPVTNKTTTVAPTSCSPIRPQHPCSPHRKPRESAPGLNKARSSGSQGSFLSNLGKSLTDALDNSVLGAPFRDSSSDEEQQDETPGDAALRSLSLQQRQAIQRAKQLAFLKEQGLIKEETLRRAGGAASTPEKATPDTASLASFSASIR